MGKNSLLKSTSEKKDEELKAKGKKKKPAVKAKPKAKAKPKVKAKPRSKAKPKAKAVAKKPVKPKAPPKKAAPPKKKVSVKDLVQKKFDPWKPEKIFSVKPEEKDFNNFSAPPFVSGAKEEVQRVKTLLLKKFDMAEIKAAAEQAAVEKSAAEKADAEETAAVPEVSVSYDPPDSGEPKVSDPMDNVMKYMIAAAVILVALVIGTSALNHSKYYLHGAEGALEIWQGSFSPMGEKLLITLPGVQPPETIKNVYSKAEAYPFIFDYYVGKADTLLEIPGMPDFDGIRSYLNKALAYTTTSDSIKVANARLNNMELMILLYKAEVAASKSTTTDLEKALNYLGEAARLDLDDIQSDLVDQKIESLNTEIKTLEEKAAEATAETSPPIEATTSH